MVRFRVRDVLVVHDDLGRCGAVSDQLVEHGSDTRAAASAAEVRRLVGDRRFDAAIFDVRSIPAPQWLVALEMLSSATPAPVVVAWGDNLTVYEGFHLARLGVRRLLPKRPRVDSLWEILNETIETRPTVEPHVKAYVGHVPLTAALNRVRELFLQQALGMTRDDRSKSSRLLGVSRQAVQRMLRRREREPDARELERPADVNRM